MVECKPLLNIQPMSITREVSQAASDPLKATHEPNMPFMSVTREVFQALMSPLNRGTRNIALDCLKFLCHIPDFLPKIPGNIQKNAENSGQYEPAASQPDV